MHNSELNRSIDQSFTSFIKVYASINSAPDRILNRVIGQLYRLRWLLSCTSQCPLF